MVYVTAMPATRDGWDVEYWGRGETKWIRRGGSRSWRTNNPGHVSAGLGLREQGAIGSIGGLAIFPDRATGRRALRAVLASRALGPLTVEQAYQRFDITYRAVVPDEPGRRGTRAAEAPPEPECPYTGILASRRMDSLNEGERERMAEAIEHQLFGWEEGTVEEAPIVRDTRAAEADAARYRGSPVLINGRSAVHAGSGGVLTTPDVCRTPTGKGCRSVLYTNVAESKDATNTASTVRINGHPACIASSRFAVSRGDEAGRCGGVRSGTTAGPAHFLTASPDVRLEGEGAVRQFDLMVSNHRNTPPMPLMQPGGPPPPAVLAAAAAAGTDTPGPNAVRVDFTTHAAQRLVLELVASTPEARCQRPLPKRLWPSDSNHLVVTGLVEGARPDLAVRIAGAGEAFHVPLTEGVPSHPFDPEGDPELETAAGEHRLAPVRFVREAAPDESPEPLRPGGRIYLFRHGRLWRELGVTLDGWYADVDLARLRGRDERPAEGLPQSEALLPERLAGAPQAYEVAYSEIAWPEARIAALEADAGERARRCTAVDAAALTARTSPAGHGLVAIADPMGAARERAEAVYALLAERAEVAGARLTGTPAVAALIQGLIKADAEARAADPEAARGEPLASHIDRARLEQTLADWEALESALDEAYPEAVDALLAVLESDAFQSAFADYTGPQALSCQRTLGLTHLARLLGGASTPASRAFIARVIRCELPALEILAHPDPEVVEALQARELQWQERGHAPLTEDDPELAHLPPELLFPLVASAGDTLETLLQTLAEGHIHLAGGDMDAALEAIAGTVQRYTGVELSVVPVAAASLLRGAPQAPANLYVFQPAEQARALQRLQGVQVPQLAAANDADIPRTAEAVRQHPLYRRGFRGALGTVQVLNAALAFRAVHREFDTENVLTVGAAVGGAAEFFGETLAPVYGQRGEQLTTQRDQAARRAQVLNARGEQLRARNPGRALDLRRQAKMARTQAQQLERGAYRSAIYAESFKFLRFVGLTLNVVGTTGLGIYDLWRGADRDNSGLAVAGALGVTSGLALVAGTITSGGLVLLLAAAAGLGAAALSAFSERSPMGLALRHGSFGLTPDTASYDGFTLAEPEPFEDHSLVPGRTFDLADREAELDELYRLLFDFDVRVRLHPVGEPPRQQPITPYTVTVTQQRPQECQATEFVVVAELRFTTFVPERTRVESRLVFEGDGGLFERGERRELALDDAALLRYERREGGTLTGLRLYARLPRAQLLGGVTCLVRLDAHGDGRHWVPKSGDFREVPAEDLLGHWMSESGWQNVVDAARHQQAKHHEENR